MNGKLEILQCIIANRAFAPSHSALAKELGYKGKMVIYRLMEGQTKSSTVDEVWDKIRECYCLSDEILYNLAYLFEGAKYCYDRLIPEMNREHPRWVENLIMSLVGDFYDYFSPDFQQKYVPYLKDLKKDEPEIFWGIVTMLYIRCKKIDLYKGDTRLVFCRLIDALDELLQTLYPERTGFHEVASSLKDLETHPNLWKAILDCSVLFRRYAEADYGQNASKCMRLFDWGKRSYWYFPATCYQPGSKVWLFVQQNYGRATNGLYIVLCLQAGKDIRTFELMDVFIFGFWIQDDEDDPCVLQVGRGAGEEREWCFYVYDYDEEKRELSLEANPETGNLFGLPETIRMINLEQLAGKDEKVWARILKMWEEEQGSTIFQMAKERLAGRIDLKDSYRLTDVQISRASFTLFVERQGNAVRYELPVDAYEFLSDINPSQQILIVKHLDDNEIYVEWPDRGYSIKLSEFVMTPL